MLLSRYTAGGGSDQTGHARVRRRGTIEKPNNLVQSKEDLEAAVVSRSVFFKLCIC